MKEKYRVFIIIYGALLAGIVFATALSITIDWNNLFNIPEEQLLYLLVPVAAIIGSEVMFRVSMKKLELSEDENTRTGVYQTSNIIRWAILEGAAFYSIMSPEDIPQINIVIIITYYMVIFPGFNKFKEIISPI
ncbi:MAG: hypothetical protein HRT66_00190 [Flavobacteriaceae bacterium]|nr:hypothetical protein [Flavobacteriaceae bacterium]